MSGAVLLLKCILGVFLPPALVLIEKGPRCDFWIDLVLTFLLVWIGGIIYAFIAVYAIDVCHSIAAALLPPLGLLMAKGCNHQFWISVLLTLLFWIPGMIYVYYVLSSGRSIHVVY